MADAQCADGCAGLKTLRLGLSGVRSLALALPHLQVLDVNGASKLRCLELRCPTLLTAFFQACRCVPLLPHGTSTFRGPTDHALSACTALPPEEHVLYLCLTY